jgi:polyisoprenoid-binding protein YceI
MGVRLMSKCSTTVVLAAVLALFAVVPTASAADGYQIDPVHSVIVFRIKHMDVGYFYGRFNSPQGSFTFDEQDPGKSNFQAQVKAADFDSGNAKRDQHVEGPDFLNAKEFPT